MVTTASTVAAGRRLAGAALAGIVAFWAASPVPADVTGRDAGPTGPAVAQVVAQATGHDTGQDTGQDTARPDDAALAAGPVTGLPLPRFVSMKAAEANVRRGPSRRHRVDWVFRHRGTPLLVTAEYGHWRQVRDSDGLGGWVHYALLSGARTVIVDKGEVAIRARPDEGARVRARAEPGVIAHLDTCEGAWCRIRAGGHRGWVPAAALWGATLPTGREAPAG